MEQTRRRNLITFAFLGCLLNAGWSRSAKAGILTVLCGLILLGLGLLPAWDIHLIPESIRSRCNQRSKPVFESELKRRESMSADVRAFELAGHALKRYARPGESLVVGGLGAVGYYSEIEQIYDIFGIVTPKVAMRKRKGPLRWPGHDKRAPLGFFLDEQPTLLLIDPRATTRKRIEGRVRKFRTGKAGSGYVPDIVPIECRDWGKANPHSRYMIIFRRLDDGADPDQAWLDFDALRDLGVDDETLIVLVADHGEAFLDHGWLGHTISLL